MVEIPGNTQKASCPSGLLASFFLAQPGPCTSKEHHMSTSEEDFSYLANLSTKVLEEELSTLAYSLYKLQSLWPLIWTVVGTFF